MRILFLTSRIPFPPNRGDKLRTYNLIRQLAKENEIYLISFSDNKKDNEPSLRELQKYCRQVKFVHLPKWFSLLKVLMLLNTEAPSQAAYYASFRMQHEVKKAVREFNPQILYMHLFRMRMYGNLVPKAYKILDLTDVISKEMFRSINKNNIFTTFKMDEARKIRRFEINATSSVDETWVISEQERADLIAAGCMRKIVVVKNGTIINERRERPDEHTILFYGFNTTGHNRDALGFLLNGILPKVKERIPGIKLILLGAGKLSSINTNGIDVERVGFVDNVGSIFERSSMLVAPIRFSAGVQNKILEAMGAGLAVITSPFGNEGIGAEPMKEIIICGTADDFANQIVYFLNNQREREQIGLAGQDFIRLNFSWDKINTEIHRIKDYIENKMV